MQVFKKVFSHNYWAILYFNFKMLPFKQAIKLPFDFYYSVRFENLSGKIKINSSEIKRGMIKIGGRGSEMFSRSTTIIDVKGEVNIHGILEIGHAVLLRVEKNGVVSFGQNVRIGAFSKIFSEQSITFGDEIDFSWECQIFDTNFHFVRDFTSQVVDSKTGKIKIGSNNWFGNRVSVMKGTITPDNVIVASNSLCNKDFLFLSPYSVIGGIPAKLIGSNKERLFENLVDVTSL